MTTKSEAAAAKFAEGYNCAQSVFYAFCDVLNFEKNLALKMTCGFGAGMGRKEEVCGAVAGGIMVIGTKYGRGEKDGPSATESDSHYRYVDYPYYEDFCNPAAQNQELGNRRGRI